MKKTIVSLLMALSLAACSNHYPAPPKTGFEGKPLPEINVLLPDSSRFNTGDIPVGQTAVVFYYSTSCPFCRAQLRDMTKNIDKLKGIRLYVITFSRFKDFKNLYNEFNIKQYPTITAGVDYKDSIGHYFKLTGVPFTAVYNSQKKLSQAFHGRISADRIKAAAE